jgi:putative ABC transport system permease protein
VAKKSSPVHLIYENGSAECREWKRSQFRISMLGLSFSLILTGFGSLALFLAALGTYGVLAYSVVQRTHEIGVRMAIGAERRTVVGMITRQGLILAVFGTMIGIPFVALVNRGIASIFEGFVPVETGSVLVVALILALVTVVASLFPALRAASVDPIEALRCE